MPSLSQRDRRALVALTAAVVVFLVFQFDLLPARRPVAASSTSIEGAEKRLRRLQESARQKPRVAAEAAAAAQALAEAEKGLLAAATPAVASAQMLEILKELLRSHGISLQTSEFGPVKPVGEDYAQVPLTIGFSCGIEQWINLMSALRNAPQVLASQDLRIAPGDPKNKSMHVRMVVAGYIRASLLPAAKSEAAL